MIDPSVPEALRARLMALAVDWRNAWLGPTPAPQTVGDSSGPDWAAFPPAAAQVAAQAAAVAPLASLGESMVATPIEPLRAAAAHVAGLVSELRMGERVTLLLEAQGWCLVAAEDGYVGWARAWSLRPLATGELDALLRRRCGRFRDPTGTLWSARASGDAACTLWMGVPLLRPRDATSSRGEVELPDGSRGVLDAAQIESQPPGGEPAQAVERARRLLGAAYRWGGRTPAGLDCSGLVQLVCGLAGFALPRDAAQQAQCGGPLELDPSAWRPGDLLFFGEAGGTADHVALWEGEGCLLHARGRVRRDRFAQLGDLAQRLCAVRRLGPRDWIREPTLWAVPPQPVAR
jgi:cell wall-associated NlpC family hydrolase